MPLSERKAFRERVLRSQEAVFTIARWFNQRGSTVIIPAVRLVPDDGNPLDYVDGGDFWFHKPGEEEKRCEVKHLSTDFTCLEDWPHRRFKVCNENAFVRHSRAADVFVMLNRAGTHVAVLSPPSTFPHWRLYDQPKSTGDGTEKVFECDPALAKFFALPPLQA